MDASSRAIARLYDAQGLRIRAYVYLRLALNLLKAEQFDALLPAQGQVVDFGCGYGLLANYLSLVAPCRMVLGIDADLRRIKVAQATVGARRNIRFECGDAATVALPPLSGAVMTDFLHHLPMAVQSGVLRSVMAALEPEGVLLIREVNPAHRPRWKYWCSVLAELAMYPDPRAIKLRNRRPEELVAELRSLGAEVEVSMADRRSPFAAILYVCRRRARGAGCSRPVAAGEGSVG
jgi:2-polyprenyl-3-methyl-5-hydroxy-6-metoxy-1,4-benzoquinol methylase